MLDIWRGKKLCNLEITRFQFSCLLCHIVLDFFSFQLWVVVATMVLGIGGCLKVEFKGIFKRGFKCRHRGQT
jgi:hypothetical protein